MGKRLRLRVIVVKSRRSTTGCNIADVERDLHGEMRESKGKIGDGREKRERKGTERGEEKTCANYFYLKC